MAIKGRQSLERKLARMSKPAKSTIRGALQGGANRVVNLAKGLVPIDEGDLKESIRSEPGRHELAVDVKAGGKLTRRPVRKGVTAPEFDYASKIEAKSPFFYTAYRALKPGIRREVNKAIKRAAALDKS